MRCLPFFRKKHIVQIASAMQRAHTPIAPKTTSCVEWVLPPLGAWTSAAPGAGNAEADAPADLIEGAVLLRLGGATLFRDGGAWLFRDGGAALLKEGEAALFIDGGAADGSCESGSTTEILAPASWANCRGVFVMRLP